MHIHNLELKSQLDEYLRAELARKGKTFDPIPKGKRAFEQVAAAIKDAILKGVWKLGERLPAEGELGHQFGVSRHTIREALRTLELSGFLAIRTGVAGGPVIKDTIMASIGNLYLDAFQMEKITIEEFTAARQAIEKVILEEAFDNADEEDIENLSANVTKARALVARSEIATDVNFEFHSLLANASKNRVFVILEKTINTIHHNLRRRIPVDFRTTKAAVLAHEKLLDALVSRDLGKAMDLLEKHIAAVRKSYHTETDRSEKGPRARRSG